MKKSADPNSDKMQAEFRQKLGNYKAAPSDFLWDKIELSLDKEEALVYKNRMHFYARLAAASLVLLLTFAAFFVPQKWQEFQNQKAEMAAARQNQTNSTASGENRVAKAPENSGNVPSGINAPETETAVTKNEVASAYKNQVAASASLKPFTQKERNTPDQSKAGRFISGPVKTGSAGLVAAANAENKTEEAVLTEENPTLAVTTTTNPKEEVTRETAIATDSKSGNIIPETENVASYAKTDSDSASGVAFQNLGLVKIISPEVVSALSQTHKITFSGQNPTVSYNEDIAAVNFSRGQVTGIPQEALAKTIISLPKSSAVSADKNSESQATAKIKSAFKDSRWMVAASYAPVHFKSGICLAPKDMEATKPGIGNPYYPNNQQKAIADYETAIQEFNQETKAAYSQVGSLAVGFKVAKKWILQTGLSYTRNQEKTGSNYAFREMKAHNLAPGPVSNDGTYTTLQTVLENDFDPNTMQVIPNADYTSQYDYQYVGVPLNVRFETGDNGFYYFAGAGCSVNFLTEATIQKDEIQGAKFLNAISVQDIKRTQPDLFRSSLWAVQLQSGLGYRLSEHLQTELGLVGNQYLSSMVKDAQAAGTKQRFPKSYGATLNLGYTF